MLVAPASGKSKLVAVVQVLGPICGWVHVQTHLFQGLCAG